MTRVKSAKKRVG